MIRLLLIAALFLPPSLSHAVAAPLCVPHISLLARGFGAPDDLRWAERSLWFGDLNIGAVAQVTNGRVRIVARHLLSPEGVIVRGHTLIVAEQGANRVIAINLKSGVRRTLLRLVNTSGQEGVDGIGPAPGGNVYVPNSPYGTLLVLNPRTGNARRVGTGLGRPVDAVRYGDGIAVPDETTGAVWLLRAGRRIRLATLATPDDVVVWHGALLATSLGDGRIWEVRPHLRLLASGFREPQGLAAVGDSLAVADSKDNAIYRLSGVAPCVS